MKRAIATSISVAMVLLVSACASHRYTVVEPRKKEFTDYRILEIRDFKCNLGDRDSKAVAARFADKLYQNIMENREEHPDKVIFEDVVRETDKTDGVLVLDGTLISFEKGSRAKRYFIGFGAGKAYCTIQSIFIDKKTEEHILKLNFDGELSMSLFGGSADEAVQGVVKAYLGYFEDYVENSAYKQAESKSLEKEKLQLASIPKDAPVVKISLRKKPLRITEIRIPDMLLEYDFFEISRNNQGSFINVFVDNNDGTVTDKATGLMWQRSGSSSSLENRGAKEYIKQLNRKQFAGYSDWRMPTVEELASLLAKSSESGVHIAPVFYHKQTICWTVDKCDATDTRFLGAWIVDFKKGQILQATYKKRGHSGGWYVKNNRNHVKAVRSAK